MAHHGGGVWVLFCLVFPFLLLLSEFGLCLPNSLNTRITHSVELPPVSPCHYPPSCSRVTIIRSSFNYVSLLVGSFNTPLPYKIRSEWLMEPDQASTNIPISSPFNTSAHFYQTGLQKLGLTLQQHSLLTLLVGHCSEAKLLPSYMQHKSFQLASYLPEINNDPREEWQPLGKDIRQSHKWHSKVWRHALMAFHPKHHKCFFCSNPVL